MCVSTWSLLIIRRGWSDCPVPQSYLILRTLNSFLQKQTSIFDVGELMEVTGRVMKDEAHKARVNETELYKNLAFLNIT